MRIRYWIALLLTMFMSIAIAISLYHPPQLSSAYPPPSTRLPILPATPNSIPLRLQILNRELGIPVEILKQMSAQQIQILIEHNAERLGVNGGRLVKDDDGREGWVLFGRTPATSNADCLSVQRGLEFLLKQYNPSIGLLRESPMVAPHRYWLTTDNALAAYALSKFNQREMSRMLMSSLQRYGYATNGLIEVIWAVPIQWPPRTERAEMITQIGDEQIWQEHHDTEARFEDWAEYTNLALLGALNEYHRGNTDLARRIFRQTLTQFNGVGFRDKAYLSPVGHGHYETYKLALALYVVSVIRVPAHEYANLRDILLEMQLTDGGFATLYSGRHSPIGDANVETTALAVLALYAYGCLP